MAKYKVQSQNEILALRIALISAKKASHDVSNTDDGGTCNLDMPILILPKWNKEDIELAFSGTGLWSCIEKGLVYICGATEGCGFRRTAMAEAMRDSLKEMGYNAYVHYKID
jgi:hypothetical protein